MQEQGNAVDLNFLVEKRVTVCGRGMILRGIALPLVRPSLGQNRATLFQLKKRRVELEILPECNLECNQRETGRKDRVW